MTATRPIDETELAAWRAETPGCGEVVHLNNAGASLPPEVVLDTTIAHLRLEATIGGYEAAAAKHDAIEGVYDSVAALLAADRSEIALVENATRAWDMAFYSVPFEPGDQVITGVAEYASNYLAFLHAHRRHGIEIVVAPDDATGATDADAVADRIGPRTKLIALTHVPTNGGLVNDAAAVGRVARDAGVLYLLDACQSAGQLPLDVDELGCDFLSVTGRKFLRAPRGTGFLYARAATTGHLHPPLVDLHSASWVDVDTYELRDDARRFENWENFVAGRLGLGAAIDHALAIGLDRIEDRVAELAGHARDELAALDGITVRDKGDRRCGIVTLTHDRVDAPELSSALRDRRINTSVSVPESTRLDFTGRDLGRMLRVSVHYFNTHAEIDALVAAVDEIART
ncbi:MAG: aminotransferase class V-fold PLP-dependent enzyme [Actinomycetota bacterium]|nr:aminotransferase class V-fold PLP-dependent enzyme [Actinomycetota bacterium]